MPTSHSKVPYTKWLTLIRATQPATRVSGANSMRTKIHHIAPVAPEGFLLLFETLLLYLFNIYMCMLTSKPFKARNDQLRECIMELPWPNRAMLRLLLDHLAKIAANAAENMMHPSNLGVVFGWVKTQTLIRPMYIQCINANANAYGECSVLSRAAIGYNLC